MQIIAKVLIGVTVSVLVIVAVHELLEFIHDLQEME